MVQDTDTTINIFSATARSIRIRRNVSYISKNEEEGQELDIYHNDAFNDR